MPQLAKIRLAGATDDQACGAANQSAYRKLNDVLAVCLTGFLFSGGSAVFVKCGIFLALKLLSSVLPRQRGPPGGHRSTSSRRRGMGLG